MSAKIKYYPQTASEYAQKHRVTKENSPFQINKRASNFMFCNDEVYSDFNDPNYISNNQKLAGACNPKTLIPPVIVPPSHDLSYWRNNNLTTHSAINDVTNIDVYQSGYQVSSCDGYINYKGYRQPQLQLKNALLRPLETKNNIQPENNYSTDNSLFQGGAIKENFTPTPKGPSYSYDDSVIDVRPNESGWMIDENGYNPEQLLVADLPANFPAGKCEQLPEMRQYNDNLFTQNIQPGVYSTNDVIEPVNSNIGISFQQQFQPTTVTSDEHGTKFTQNDPRLFVQPPPEEEEETTNIYNVYDPRFSGAGTSYRTYSDDLLGQTKFYYDDVDAIRMPNYITRSKVDIFSGFDHYGPMQKNIGGNPNTPIMHQLASDEFLNNSLMFRSGMQESLMRKNNAMQWQKRMYPLSGASGQRMSSGGR